MRDHCVLWLARARCSACGHMSKTTLPSFGLFLVILSASLSASAQSSAPSTPAQDVASTAATGRPDVVRNTAPPSSIDAKPSTIIATALLRGVVPLDTLGFATLSDLSFQYRTQSYFGTKLELAPLGLGLTDEGNVFSGSGHLFAGFISPYFDLMVGGGVSSANGFSEAHDVNFSLAGTFRVGRDNGPFELHATANMVVAGDRWKMGDVRGGMQFRVHDGWRLVLNGGGGSSGYRFAEAGVRVRVRGEQDGPRLYFNGTLGGGGFFDDRQETCTRGEFGEFCERLEYSGPLAGLGLEARW